MGSLAGHQHAEERMADRHDLHCALASLMQELDAVDGNSRRAEACVDRGLREIIEHHRDKEIAYAATLLAWVRHQDPCFPAQLKDFPFADYAVEER